MNTDRAWDILKQYDRQILDLPGVHGVALGNERQYGGENRLCVIVHVAYNSLLKTDSIFSELERKGLPVIVVPSDPPVQQSGLC